MVGAVPVGMPKLLGGQWSIGVQDGEGFNGPQGWNLMEIGG